MSILLIVLLVLLLGGGGIGVYGRSAGWSPYYLGGGLGTLIIVLLILYLLGAV